MPFLSSKKSLTRSLNPEDWIRVDFYAPRVKVFSCHDYFCMGPKGFVDPEIFQAVAVREHGESHFLPCLFDLNWGGDTAVYSYISLFLGPQLTRLSFCAPDGLTTISPATITSIKSTCPFLRNLWINRAYLAKRSDLFASVSDVIGHLSVIENLTSNFPLSPTSILHLSRLPTLKYMGLFDHPMAITHSLVACGGASMSPFSHLTSLTITAWDGPSLVKLFRTLNLIRLAKLMITLNDPSMFSQDGNAFSLSEYHPSLFKGYQPSPIDDLKLAHIFEALCDSCSCGLHSLSIGIRPWPRHPPVSPPFIMRPLLRLTSLTFLSLKDVRGFDLDDAIMHEMTSAWPLLRHLDTNNRHVAHPKVTLHGFSNILGGCSQLEELHISIYVSASDVTTVKSMGCITNRSMHTLDLGYSEAEKDIDPVELAEVVNSLCPNLHSFHVVPKTGHCESWDVVQNVVWEWGSAFKELQ